MNHTLFRNGYIWAMRELEEGRNPASFRVTNETGMHFNRGAFCALRAWQQILLLAGEKP